MKKTKPRYVIRRGDSEGPEKYLDWRGQWVGYEQAKQFPNANAADLFAIKKGLVNYGLFPRSKPRRIQDKSKPNATPKQAPPSLDDVSKQLAAAYQRGDAEEVDRLMAIGKRMSARLGGS